MAKDQVRYENRYDHIKTCHRKEIEAKERATRTRV